MATIRRPEPRYRFLDGSELLLSEVVQGGDVSGKMRYAVYNIHKPLTEIRPQINDELKAQGWMRPMSTASGGGSWWKSIGASRWTVYTSALSGKAELGGAPANGVSVDPKRTITGWTTVIVTDELPQSWWDRFLDRFRPPPPDLQAFPITIVMGKEEIAAPPPSRKP
jgi:hypothetical protein